jgi:hypothetical protein
LDDEAELLLLANDEPLLLDSTYIEAVADSWLEPDGISISE